MHYYWSEITINPGALVGNAARDYVRDTLGLAPVAGDAKVTAASATWKERKVTGELLLTAIRTAGKSRSVTVAFKKDESILNRAADVLAKYDNAGSVRREDENTRQSKHHPYVIVGCGAAAIVDHTTLRQTKWGKDRVAGSRIVHVGFEDPWSHYNAHEMGQFPQLLGLPGYVARPASTESTAEPRKSTAFGANTAQEVARLKEHQEAREQELEVYPFAVALIQPRGVTVHDDVLDALVKEGIDLAKLDEALAEEHPEKWGQYRLLLVDTAGKLGWGYARCVDICTGAGKPRAADEKMVGKEVYEKMRTRIWQPVESWGDELKQRPILTGTEALYAETDWSGEKRYCVMGSGGVAVNMLERSRDTGKWVDWLATGTLHASFPIGRNDILLRHPHTWNVEKTAIATAGEQMAMNDLGSGRKNQLVPMDPASKKWRLGQGSDVDKARVADDKVTVDFKASERNNKYENVLESSGKKGATIASQIRDYWEKDTALTAKAFPISEMAQAAETATFGAWKDTPGVYDRLIRASGQDIRDVGQAEKMAAHLTLKPIPADSDGRMVGLQTADTLVRVLGAAGTGNANMVADTTAGPYKVMSDYHETLPAQGQIMLVGFVFSSLNVAMANHYFDPGNKRKASAEDLAPTTAVEPNTNVNTMSRRELSLVLGDEILAAEIVELRLQTQEGFLTTTALAELVVAGRYGSGPLADGWKAVLDRSITNLGYIDYLTATSNPATSPLTNRVVLARRRRKRMYSEPDRDQLKLDIEAIDAGREDDERDLRDKLSRLVATRYRPADPYVF